MAGDDAHIEFSSGGGWLAETMSFRCEPQIVAELLLSHKDGRKLHLELSGLKSPEAMIQILYGFDEFEIIEQRSSPYAEFGRFLFRIYVDDEKSETIVDGYNEYELEKD
jgi:hypothetical protein